MSLAKMKCSKCGTVVVVEEGSNCFNQNLCYKCLLANQEIVNPLTPQKSLPEIQDEVAGWSLVNFGDQISKATGQVMGSLNPLHGMMEEMGELVRCHLKRDQGIRGFDNPEKFATKRNDALADILIFMCDYASREGVDLLTVLNDTWNRVVSKRDWKTNKEQGT
jgi:NTP pyrophosphatase (non-canonical NTP hydrolase)